MAARRKEDTMISVKFSLRAAQRINSTIPRHALSLKLSTVSYRQSSLKPFTFTSYRNCCKVSYSVYQHLNALTYKVTTTFVLDVLYTVLQ